MARRRSPNLFRSAKRKHRGSRAGIRGSVALGGLIGGIAGAILFLFSLGPPSARLVEIFERREESPATRIYSDLPRVGVGMKRAEVQRILQRAGQSIRATGPETLAFQLRNWTYPPELLPRDHPQRDAGDRPVELVFDSASPKEGRLQSIRIGDHADGTEIFFDPELITIFAPSHSTADEPEGDSAPAADTMIERREIRTPAPFERIPHELKLAIMAVEDPHFLDHRGFDPRGLLRAVWVNLKSLRLAQGGSTITQQLVKNLTGRQGKNVFRKIQELFLSIYLELRYDKEVIFERYLNEVYLGQAGPYEVHGVVEASRLFFNKSLDELTLSEMALMAGLIRGPAYYSPYRHWDRARERQRYVLRRMADAGFLIPSEAERAATQAIRVRPPQESGNRAPWFSDFVKAELVREFSDSHAETELFSLGLNVYTTLDPELNAWAQDSVREAVQDVEARYGVKEPSRLEGALVAADPSTGFVKALIGGRSFARSGFNRVLNMRRQVGSTFKPFVVLTALMKGSDATGVPYGGAYPVEDSEWTLNYDDGRQKWTPRNYDPEFRGWIPLREALAHSINTVSSRLGIELGIPRVIETARALGIESPLEDVPSLSLGIAELSPMELLAAYATIANHGNFDSLTTIRVVTDSQGKPLKRWIPAPDQKVPAAAADQLTDLMTSVFTEGTARSAKSLGWDRPAAGKTGTTSQHRDAWFAGYVPGLAAVGWVGFDENTPATLDEAEAGRPSRSAARAKPPELTGASAALPMWIRFMKAALRDRAAESFGADPSLGRIAIDLHSGDPAQDGCPASQVAEELYPAEAVEDRPRRCELAPPPSHPATIED